jgi:hypothetical protein
LRKLIFHLLIVNMWRNDDVASFLQVRWGGNVMFVGKLYCVNDTQYLVEVPAHIHWVGHHQANLFTRIYNETERTGSLLL